MRSLFILLAVMNVCYLIWGVAFSEKKEPVVSQEIPESPQLLTLLNEKPDDVVPRQDSTAFLKDTADDKEQEIDAEEILSTKCFSIGPFFEDKEVSKLEEKLTKGGHNPKRKSITDKEPKSYWVYMAPHKTMEDAKLAAEELKAAKVKDYFIIRTGKNAKAISLGLYNGYRRAKLRKASLKKQGFDVSIQTRYKDVTRHWLDFHETATKTLKNADWKDKDQDNVLQKVARPCVDPLPESG